MRNLFCLFALVNVFAAFAQTTVPVCDLSDRDTILKVYSNDSDPAVVEGETPGSLALGVTFQPVNEWPSVRFDLPKIQDWSDASVLHVRLLNESNITQTIEIGVQDINGRAYKPGRRIPPGKWTDIRIPIRNMALGTDDGSWCGDAIDITQIKLFWFLAYSPARPLKACFSAIELVTTEKLPAPVVTTRGASDGVTLSWNSISGARVYDIYRRAPGEREERLCRFPVARFVDTTAKAGINYRYRVIALDEFLNPGQRSRTVLGKVDLRAKSALPKLDQYGGRADIKLKSTGFFRTEQFNGKWVLVTPEGHPMLSVGMCVVGLGDSYTRVSKREHLFTDDIAQKEDPRFAAAWNPPYGYSPYGLEEGKGLVFSPYVRNLILKYGPDWYDKWQAEAVKRLNEWHVNTGAAWSVGGLARPYTPFTAGWGDTPMIPKGDGGFMTVPDVFDPAFEINIEKSTASIGEMKNDPWLIGWFTANEMGWYGNWEAGMNLIALVHTAPVDLAAKKAWVEFLKGRYTSITAMNENWQTDFTDWDALLNNTTKPPRSAGYKDDSSAFLELFADRYFGVISRAIRKQDPNHMILGARHSQGSASEVIRAESKYNDVVSATIYGFRPNNSVRNGSCDTDKPWIAGEFHFQAEDAGLPFRQVEGIFPTQAERGEAYQDYIADGFGLSNFIGAHWFEYIDEPATGRFDGGKDGGEAHNIGWVNVNDDPYEEFVKRAALINANLPLILK